MNRKLNGGHSLKWQKWRVEFMSKEAVKVTGAQVKRLLTRAVGGIYMSRGFHDILTDYSETYIITETALEIKIEDATILTIPINETEQYINYAISGEDLARADTWEGSTIFAYKFYLEEYMICFNLEDKGTKFTWTQFQELTNSKNNAIFKVSSKDTCAFYLAVDNCTIDVNDREIEINSNRVNVIIDKDIVDTIYNDSTSTLNICYRLKFNNGMPEILINVEKSN